MNLYGVQTDGTEVLIASSESGFSFQIKHHRGLGVDTVYIFENDGGQHVAHSGWGAKSNSWETAFDTFATVKTR